MHVLYFAWLKEHTGCAEEDINPPESVATVEALIAWLCEQGPGYAKAFENLDIVRCAVNQDYGEPNTPVSAGDEVAFFPPVTGGGA